MKAKSLRAKTRLVMAALLFAMSSPALAAGGGGAPLPEAPLDDSVESLQRGAALFVNYCLGCHSAQHMTYGRMTEDLQITPEQMREHLLQGGAGLGDGMLSAMSEEDGRAWFNEAAPPDLSLVARVRGTDWLYAYLRSFYKDDTRPTGWNNAVFENVAMPHVMADLQGVLARDENGELNMAIEGRMTPTEYNAAMADLTAFLQYIAEPSRKTRLRTGYIVMAALMLTLVFAYFLYREYWRDIP